LGFFVGEEKERKTKRATFFTSSPTFGKGEKGNFFFFDLIVLEIFSKRRGQEGF